MVIKGEKQLVKKLINAPKLVLEKVELNISTIKDELIVEELIIDKSTIKFPSKATTFHNVRSLLVIKSPLMYIHQRFPNLVMFTVDEKRSKKSFHLGTGKKDDKFPFLQYVIIEKRGTWSSLDAINDKIEQFSNVPNVRIQYKAIVLEGEDPVEQIPHDLVDVKRINRAGGEYYKLQLTYMKDETGIQKLKLNYVR